MQLINGRYILHDPIDEGGMGIVYLATDRLTQQLVALKQVQIGLDQMRWLTTLAIQSKQSDLNLILANEFKILAGLRHPNIISVLDYGFDNKSLPYYTMGYLVNAQTILEAGSELDVHGRMGLVQQMLQALHYLHQRSILHRDLKPNNALVTKGHLRLVDFGLASSKDKDTTSGGTLLYMSPEVLLDGQAPFTEASDLYAIGVMAYQLLAGDHPFEVERGEFISQVIHQPPNLSKLGDNRLLAQLIGRLLAKRPEHRYQNAGDCLKDLRKVMGDVLQPETPEIRESFLQAADFVGRKFELTQLRQAISQNLKGKGSVWLIGGESGVGKTRLLDEIRIEALVKKTIILQGQAVMAGGLPFQLWRELTRHLCILVDVSDEEAGILLDIVPDISDLLQRHVTPASLATGGAFISRLAKTILSLLKKSQHPIALFLEDLQWTRESLDILKAILPSIPKLPILILATYRYEERSSLSKELATAQNLLLDRLNEEETETLGYFYTWKIRTK